MSMENLYELFALQMIKDDQIRISTATFINICSHHVAHRMYGLDERLVITTAYGLLFPDRSSIHETMISRYIGVPRNEISDYLKSKRARRVRRPKNTVSTNSLGLMKCGEDNPILKKVYLHARMILNALAIMIVGTKS